MNSNISKLLFQHIINQLSATWALPSDSVDIPKVAPTESESFIQSGCRYLSEHKKLTRMNSVAAICEETFGRALSQVAEGLVKNDFQILTCIDSGFPSALRHINRFPLALFLRGEFNFSSKPLVAIVGARRATKEALSASYQLGHDLARNGYCIISGGAFGCDAAAHKGAIDSGAVGGTAAVFASGIANLYPRQLKQLYEDILKVRGTLISERLPWVFPQRFDFPIRNRIIAGMVEELHVMQAGEKSGAMITANLALDYGRDVRVWNPNLDDIRFAGNSKLINLGAENSQSTDKTIKWDGPKNHRNAPFVLESGA